MSAILVISLVTAVAAEAPYHLPRPAHHTPVFNYAQPAPPPLHHHLPQPHVSQVFHPQPGYNYAHPQIQFQQQPRPQLQTPYYASPQPTPQRLPVNYPRPQQIYQQPSFSYGQPQAQPLPAYTAQIPVEPIRPLPGSIVPQQQSPIAYYQQQQFSSGQGYAYQQPQLPIVPFISQLPLQSQSFSSTPLSSYQADTNQYNTVGQSQTHSEALDSTVVSQVQNIIKENEHTSAKEAGFLSLVSGVTLENVKPSIEVTSFVQNSLLPTSSVGLTPFSSSSSSSASTSSLTGSYSSPAIKTADQSNSSSGSLNFLPQTQPASSYGPPN
ncbi:daxx-like protein [Battus philenor]|uniref:daxx-like protein n=1 Tax=Battus philenor TaxID=42288 RepID=UPI0035CF9B97